MNYIEANDLEKATDRRKIALFMLLCGSELKTKLATFSVDPSKPDKLVIGIKNSALRERLLREKGLTEASVVEHCKIVKQSHLQS